MKRILKVTAGLFTIFALAVVGAALYINHLLHEPYKSYTEPKVAITIERGTSVNKIAHDLRNKGVIRHPWLLKGIFIARQTQGKSKAGDYVFEKPLSPLEVYEKLMKGEMTYMVLTIVEGANIFDIEKLFAEKDLATTQQFRQIIQSADVLAELNTIEPGIKGVEGFLFPETYYLSKQEDAKKAVILMLRQFKRNFGEAEKKEATAVGMTPLQVVTLASLIEKETGQESERTLISGVFHNRLKKSMLLQCDPTIIYGLMLEGRYRGEIYRSDIQYPSPYNTYVSPGLPPGPICNPGRESLRAAISPAQTEMLYFVSKNDGTHYFSSNINDHKRAVQQYQRNGGRSR